MEKQLTDIDFDVILDSLRHYKMNIENYDRYPSYNFKLQQLERVDTATRNVKALRRELAQTQN
jgi:hypothetical protein